MDLLISEVIKMSEQEHTPKSILILDNWCVFVTNNHHKDMIKALQH